MQPGLWMVGAAEIGKCAFAGCIWDSAGGFDK
jgi:hypothetical protein